MINELLISIVIPVYQSEKFIDKTVEKTLQIIKRYKYNAELILVNDGSPDNSWHVIRRLAEKHVEVKAINLVKNYGQHNAVLCGFRYAKGDYVVTMDDDLQNPPSEIVHLVNKMQQDGHDLVFGKFEKKKHAAHRRLGSKIIGYLNEVVFNKPRHITLTNFRIIRKDVIKRVLLHRTSYPYIPGLLLIYASDIGNVLVSHHEREDGKSNYTAKKILSLVARLLINYSSYPLRLLSGLGFIVSSASFITSLVYLLSGMILGTQVPGWTTLVVLISFLGGFIIALLGIIGEYLARILDQLATNESYFVDEVVN